MAGERFAAQIAFAAFNAGASLGFTPQQCIKVINAVTLGDTADNRVDEVLDLADFLSTSSGTGK